MKRNLLLGVLFAILAVLAAPLVVAFLAPKPAEAQFTPRTLLLRSNGVDVGYITILDTSGLTATRSGRTGTLALGTVPASSGGTGNAGLIEQVLLGQGDGVTPVWRWYENKHLIECGMASIAATALTCYGGTANSAGGSNQQALTGSTRNYVGYATTTTLNNTNGWCAVATSNTNTDLQTRTIWNIRTHDSDIGTQRIWAVHSSANISLTAVPPFAGTTTTVSYWGFGYEAGVNSGRLGCCMGDGSNHGCTDTGVTVATGTEYDLMAYFNGTTLYCSVNGAAVVTNSSNPPASLPSSNLDTACITNLSGGTARTFYLGGINIYRR